MEDIQYNPIFANFVLGVDVTWFSETGHAGCNVIFRGETDVRDGEFAVFDTMRLSGSPQWLFAVVKYNQYQSEMTGRLSNLAINTQNGSTNHYVIVADGLTVRAYANGVRLGTRILPERVTKGHIYFEAWQYSNSINCTFSNAWVWELPDS